MTEECRDLRLPAELCQAAEKKWGNRFASVEELLTVVLRELLRDEVTRMDEAEQRIVEERLRDLGYI